MVGVGSRKGKVRWTQKAGLGHRMCMLRLSLEDGSGVRSYGATRGDAVQKSSSRLPVPSH